MEDLKTKYKETVGAMSNVLTDIANELNIPIEKHGDPDEIFYAIESMQSELTALKSALVILPDDAEPEVGDLIEASRGLSDPFSVTKGNITHAVYIAKELGRKILRRNGKPVIYANQLKGGD